MAARTIEELREIINRTSTKLSNDLKNQGIPSPTVNNTVARPSFESIDLNASRELLDAVREVEALVMGPQKMLTYMAVIYHDVTSLGALLEFNIPALVPLEGTVSISSLASQSGLSEDKLTRFIRYAATNFIFCEPLPGIIGHTAASAALARDPAFCNFLRWLTVDLAAVQASIPVAAKKWPLTEKMNECAVNYASGTNGNFWQWMNGDPVRQSRFHQAIAGHAGGGGGLKGRSLDVEAYPWAEKLGRKAVVVDVGGGSGYFSRALALAYPEFTITVQDRAAAFSASAARSDKPSNLNFQEHDFFTPQPLRDADAYFLRHILHDWPRAEAVSILRNLLPALKPGARVLVSEHLMPGGERGESLLEDKMIRQVDMQMMGVLNSKERTTEDYAALFQEADKRLKFRVKYQLPEDKKSWIFEAVWETDS
ncbi:S-adenosyl-L-methionine-dependent methyltransferase [Annulohypoxylon maeteangense]|uniref:S-adenosyl-L-methionine-dependent methyltransferase n=1 Tax=Annulohypoxylon maeteangense TaxID=1927788 RepID=UPI002008AEA9|nr:S-adenosyl-L-methionine-dependent methyltransferase [Annulohypoxylon maeteangense]KAI0883529.1 S-adenosyl-L-methionine-dependent methyltransferase [Annulohypoxylon maeteangense]